MNPNHYILRGPGGITLTLDVKEVYPDDPGAGCPSLVSCKGSTGSYECAIQEGVLGCGRQDVELTPTQIRWLEDQYEHVNAIWERGIALKAKK